MRLATDFESGVRKVLAFCCQNGSKCASVSQISRNPRVGLAAASGHFFSLVTIRFLLFGTLTGFLLLFASPRQAIAQEEEPEAPAAADNSDVAPAGVSGAFSGVITTGCGIDPFTRSYRREIDDVVIPSAVGGASLK